MQRVFDLLKDDGPAPESGEPLWLLGRRYEVAEGGVWSEEFLEDVNKLVWLMYRTQFPTPIPRHPDGPSPLLQNMSTFLRSGPYAVQASTFVDSFTSDVGWGCMIRTGQSLLANATLKILSGGTGSRDGPASGASGGGIDEIPLLRKFSDDPSAPYSIHRFVEYGAEKCGKLPGQWFGPSAVAACIAKFAEPPLNVYISQGADVFEQDLLELQFPVLVLCGLRLGIQEVNPVYYAGLQSLLTAKQSVGIAGGRTSASHYFYGFQGHRLFFHDPHEPKPSVTNESPDSAFTESMHSRRVRVLDFASMDPSMLAGFLLMSRDDFEDWKTHLGEVPAESRVIHILEERPASRLLEDLSDEEEGVERDMYGTGSEQSAKDENADDDLGGGSSSSSSSSSSSQRRGSTSVKKAADGETSNSRLGGASYVMCEPILHEPLVTVDVHDPCDESTIELSQPLKEKASKEEPREPSREEQPSPAFEAR